MALTRTLRLSMASGLKWDAGIVSWLVRFGGGIHYAAAPNDVKFLQVPLSWYAAGKNGSAVREDDLLRIVGHGLTPDRLDDALRWMVDAGAARVTRPSDDVISVVLVDVTGTPSAGREAAAEPAETRGTHYVGPPGDDGVLRELKRLSAAGVSFYVSLYPTGARDVSPADALRYARDPEQFWREEFGVTEERYQQWRATVEEHRCTGTTRSGGRCKNDLQFIPRDPTEHRSGRDDRCPLHRECTGPGQHEEAE